mgnify:FL=1
MQYRQGDVLLTKREIHIPSDAKTMGRIVAVGEKTGHHHELEGNAELIEVGMKEQVIMVKDKARLVHPEHGPIDLEPGTYVVVRQVEHEGEKPKPVPD